MDTFEYLTVGLQELLLLASTDGPVAYLEAEFFGGLGTQAAAVWDSAYPATGPVRHDSEVEPDVPATLWPFNTALRALGVRATETTDEFDVVGLGGYRCTEDWAQHGR